MFTKMQVSWSPMALCSSAATTDESTPPLRPSTTFSSPTCRRTRAHVSSMNDPIVQSIGAVTNVEDEILQDLFAARRVRHFRMKLQPVKLPLDIFDRGEVGIFRARHCAKSLWHRRQLVAVTAPDVDLRSDAVEQN